jgi:hypothetical protein
LWSLFSIPLFLFTPYCTFFPFLPVMLNGQQPSRVLAPQNKKDLFCFFFEKRISYRYRSKWRYFHG